MIEENAAAGMGGHRRASMVVRRMRSAPGPSGATKETAAPAPIDRALLERWALAYLERYASSAENLRRVLERRVWRRARGDGAGDGRIDGEPQSAAGALIDALVARYCRTGLVDDAAYAAARARSGLARGHSLRAIAAGLAAKGVGAADAAAALAALAEDALDPDLAAASAFARRRRLGPFRRAQSGGGDTADPDRRRELAAFARAGFERRTAEAVLACADEAAVAELLATTN
jgi:regulatory protein